MGFFKTTARKKEVYMGSVNVDTGQLIICDPCYVDSNWEMEDFEDIRIYRNIDTGDTLQYGVDFKNYESPIEKYDNQTMNRLNKTGKWVLIEDYTYKKPFSYNACVKTTMSEGFGELGSGTAVVLSTTIGDGRYPVYGKFNDDGVLDSVVIKFKYNFYDGDPDQ